MYLASDMNKCIYESFVDGDGIRLVIFLNGCNHKCIGCHNPQTWVLESGMNFPVDMISDYIIKTYNAGLGYYSGITFSGGDPLLQHKELDELILMIKKEIPDINIWCYTGYKYEDIKAYNVLKNIDVLVDGKFEIEKRSYNKPFRGSDNQRLLYLNEGVIIEET